VRHNLIKTVGAVRPLSLSCALRVLSISANPIEQHDPHYHVRLRVLLPGVFLAGTTAHVVPSPSKLAVPKRSYQSMHMARQSHDQTLLGGVLTSLGTSDATLMLEEDVCCVTTLRWSWPS
jgi:hypothetical protein